VKHSAAIAHEGAARRDRVEIAERIDAVGQRRRAQSA